MIKIGDTANPGETVTLESVSLPFDYPAFPEKYKGCSGVVGFYPCKCTATEAKIETVKITMRIPLVRPGVYETDWWIVKMWKAYGPRWFWKWRYDRFQSKQGKGT